MLIKKCKSITNGRRGMTISKFNGIGKMKKKCKFLFKSFKNMAGRNNNGRITVRRRGGGHKRKYRIIDFKRNKYNIEAIVKMIEYNPNCSANIALIYYKDGIKSYILAPKNLKIGDKVISGIKTDIKIGNSLLLENIPIGIFIHNIELKVGKGGQLARSAGSRAQLLGFEKKYALVRLKSGEVRMIFKKCRATIGEVGNEEHELIKLGKAGRNRWLRRRPKVRGSAMNPCDHPHGGGEGKTSIGRKSPLTPWGKPTLGYKTRKKKSKYNKFIIRSRKKKNR